MFFDALSTGESEIDRFDIYRGKTIRIRSVDESPSIEAVGVESGRYSLTSVVYRPMYNLGIFRASRIEIEKPLVKEAYDVLGPAKVREMNYHQSNIKKQIIKRKDETLFTKAFLLLDRQLPKQVAIPKTVIKQKLSEVYKELGIQSKASASDLEK